MNNRSAHVKAAHDRETIKRREATARARAHTVVIVTCPHCGYVQVNTGMCLDCRVEIPQSVVEAGSVFRPSRRDDWNIK